MQDSIVSAGLGEARVVAEVPPPTTPSSFAECYTELSTPSRSSSSPARSPASRLRAPSPPLVPRVHERRVFASPTEASVRYDITVSGASTYPGRIGQAKILDGRWKVARETVCADITFAGGSCPAK